jgi:DNA polymerase-3 subunit chi
MTQVDFYILEQPDSPSLPLMACRVADKAFRNGHRVYVLANDSQQMKELDQLMWTFSQGSFTPHETYSGNIDNELTPILIGADEAPEAWHDILITLTEEVPAFFSRFERVIEIVGNDEEQKKNARNRFRFYRDRGYALQSHPV